MNKKAIHNTAVCHWDRKEKCFIVQSPLYGVLKGISDNEQEAWEIFEDFLDDAYTSYLEGRLAGMYGKAGRPAKNRVALSCQVAPETLENVKSLAGELGVSQGECIDYLYAHLHATQSMKASKRSTAALSAAAKAKTRSAKPKAKTRK